MQTPKNFLNQTVTVTIDRPIGSKHPEYDFVYPINYGYIAGVMAPDGECLDAYVLGVNTPIKTFTGTCIAIIHRLDDNEDKLIVVPEDKTFTDEQIKKSIHFQEQFFTSTIIRT